MAEEQTPAPAEHKEGTANTISVSLQRSPVFYANLTKRFLHGSPSFFKGLQTICFVFVGGELEVKLTGLGDATTTVVGACEILKRQEGLVTVCFGKEYLPRQNSSCLQVTKVETSLSERGQARLMVVVTKGPKFDELDKDPAEKGEAKAV